MRNVKYIGLFCITVLMGCTTIFNQSLHIQINNNSNRIVAITIHTYIDEIERTKEETFIIPAKTSKYVLYKAKLNSKKHIMFNSAMLYDLKDIASLKFERMFFFDEKILNDPNLTDAEVIFYSAWKYQTSYDGEGTNNYIYTLDVSNRLLQLTSTDPSMFTKFKDYYNQYTNSQGGWK